MLRKFLKGKGAQKDKDVSNAEFNVACQISLELAKETVETKRRELEKEWKLLRKSCGSFPAP